ncbi:PrgI family protein [Candidatus Parcubacteria bacterium]|jgi:hypothetical protein|nr:PrgI family protein [Candidatus Parcubacteria bacterium]
MEDKFIVPQFIDAEDKIWGPITVRQFVIIIAGGVVIFLAYKLADFSLFLFETTITSILVLVFAFVKINGAPFHIFALNFVETTFKKPKIRIWRKEYIRIEKHKSKNEDIKPEALIAKKAIVPSKKLSELSLIIDTGGVFKGEKDANEENNAVYSEK